VSEPIVSDPIGLLLSNWHLVPISTPADYQYGLSV